MAKISAHGATALERLDTGERVYVLCSDGRVLYATRFNDGNLSTYAVYGKMSVEEGRRLLAEKRATATATATVPGKSIAP